MSLDKSYLPLQEGQLITDILKQDHELIVELIATCKALLQRLEAAEKRIKELETAYMEENLLGKTE